MREKLACDPMTMSSGEPGTKPRSSCRRPFGLLDRINTLRGEILAGQRMHAMALDQSPQHAVEFFKQGYGPEPRKKLGEVRDKAKEFLKPIAQLGASRG
jgi:hypothetical protein